MKCHSAAISDTLNSDSTLPGWLWVCGKSMCISEGHGGAGLACGPASAHCILSRKRFLLGSNQYPILCYIFLFTLQKLKEKRKSNQKVKAIMNVTRTDEEKAPFQDLQEFDEVRKQEDGYDQYFRCS